MIGQIRFLKNVLLIATVDFLKIILPRHLLPSRFDEYIDNIAKGISKVYDVVVHVMIQFHNLFLLLTFRYTILSFPCGRKKFKRIPRINHRVSRYRSQSVKRKQTQPILLVVLGNCENTKTHSPFFLSSAEVRIYSYYNRCLRLDISCID